MTHRVLIVYYSFTNQTRRVAEAMAESFAGCDCQVDQCPIEFTDPRYPLAFPFVPFWRRLLAWLPRQVLGRTGEIRLPEGIGERDYDLICIGSPTWWLYPAMPVVSFLKSDAAGGLLDGKPFAVFAVCRGVWWNNLRKVRQLARRCGGRFVRGAAFCFQGNQVQSLASFVSYMKSGSDRERYWGMRIYPFGVSAEGLDQAGRFARELAADLQTASLTSC